MADMMSVNHKIRTPATIMISGPTSSGKTRLVEEIVGRLSEVFDRPPKRVICCYSRDQDLYGEMQRKCPVPMRLVKGLPPELHAERRSLIIIDDLQEHGQEIERWFTKLSHHSDCDVIYIVQNLFIKSNYHRTCNLNSHVLCVFKNPRDKMQIMCLARQIAPDNPKYIVSAFNQATIRPHGYLLFNLKQCSPEHLRVRDSFLVTRIIT